MIVFRLLFRGVPEFIPLAVTRNFLKVMHAAFNPLIVIACILKLFKEWPYLFLLHRLNDSKKVVNYSESGKQRCAPLLVYQCGGDL